MPFDSQQDALNNDLINEAIQRGVIVIADDRVTYKLSQQKSYDWTDPEEWVRAHTIAWLIIARDYPTNRIRTEVSVPRRTPNDFADIVVYRDDQCRIPYLVVENKPAGQRDRTRNQAIEQLFGNANSLRASLGLYDEGDTSILFDVENYPSTERVGNRRGDRDSTPSQYGDVPEFVHIAGQPGDIEPGDTSSLNAKIRRAHYIIWAGGRRDPLSAFDEWSKLLFAKVIDERTTPTGQPRRFQVGNGETNAAIANRVHNLFREATRSDPSIFPPNTRIALNESKIADVVRCLQSVSFTRTDVDSIGRAFEEFFGSVFRGELGQYFTMRQLARFTIAVLDIVPTDYVLDPTCGSGGFLLEVLLQTWHRIERDYAGQPLAQRERLKTDFALAHVYGIEIHEILARICKINLLLHHDGHTNIEADRSCLDSVFSNARLNNPAAGFSKIVGNPPFGDEVKENDEDHLGSNVLTNFRIASGRNRIASEQVIIERCIQFLEPGGRFGLVLPDGVLNNQGDQSNCPQTRSLLARTGFIEAIISLPDHAFRKSGAQNKTSILFFKKFTNTQQRNFDRAYNRAVDSLVPEHERSSAEALGTDRYNVVAEALVRANLDYKTFLAEANHVGYSSAGSPSPANDLYRTGANGSIHEDQTDTILNEWRIFSNDPEGYQGRSQPDCMAIAFSDMWRSHTSHRLDPKYHLFEREAGRIHPDGWVRVPISAIMRRRLVPQEFEPDQIYTVLTISQTGELRHRPAGKGHNPPQWLGEYFSLVSPGDWFAVRQNDLVFSSIDLWKGCVSIVGPEFDGALVTKEYPIYEITDERVLPEFVQILLRTRHYQRAFRAITTGHSNRRRTQIPDFEAVEIQFPPDQDEQRRLIAGITQARAGLKDASATLRRELLAFSDHIDGRGAEELPVQEEDETSTEG